MNDDELITAVKESVTHVHMNVPVEQIVSRSRAVRARRRIPGGAAAPGAAAAVAVAVTMALPASHPASRPSARLAASWTVTRKADGTIRVRFFGPAALQRALRADGIPASVTFNGQQNPACHSIPAGGPQTASGKPPLTAGRVSPVGAPSRVSAVRA